MSDRICYMIDQTMCNDKGQWVPAVVKENQPGYYPTNWSWVGSFENAQVLVDQLNTRLGLSKEDVWKITASSMGASNQLVRAKHTSLQNLPLLMDSKSEEVLAVVKKRFSKGR